MLPNFEVLENEMIDAGDTAYQCRAQGCHIHKDHFELEQE